MTRREDFAALRKLVETMAPRPEQASALRLFEFYDLAVDALLVIDRDVYRKSVPITGYARQLARNVLRKLDEEIE